MRREQIARATIRALARHGYAGLTMKRLAHEAGVTPGILHYYFPNKRAILVAALEAVMADLELRIARHVPKTDDPRTLLRAVLAACLGMAREHHEVWGVFLEFWSAMMRDRGLLRRNAALYRRLRRSLALTVAQGGRARQFRRVAAKEAGTLILAIIDGLSLQRAFDPDALSGALAVRIAEDAVRAYLGGFAHKRGWPSC